MNAFYNVRLFGIFLLMVVSVFGALPTKVGVGPISLSAVLTIGIALYFFFVFLLFPGSKKIFVFHAPLLIFLLMNIVWLIAGEFTLRSFQRVTVWAGIVSISLSVSSWGLRATSFDRKLEMISDSFSNLSVLYVLVLLYQIVFGSTDPATSMLLVLFFSFYISKVHSRKALLLSLLALLVNARIVVLGFYAIYILFLIRKGFYKTLLASLMLTVFLVLFLIQFLPQYIGLNGGDNALVLGSYTLNTSGRLYAWGLMIDSIMLSPILGHGTDLAPALVGVERWSHPHNDYLRLLHQCGSIGLALYLIFYIRLHLRVLQTLKLQAGSQRGVFLNSSLYSTLGIAVLMLTDNPLSYSYVIYLLAVLNGLASACTFRSHEKEF